MAGQVMYDSATILLFHEKKKHELIVNLKLLYYTVLVLWQFLKYFPPSFSLAFSSAMVYNLFGEGLSFF